MVCYVISVKTVFFFISLNLMDLQQARWEKSERDESRFGFWLKGLCRVCALREDCIDLPCGITYRLTIWLLLYYNYICCEYWRWAWSKYDYPKTINHLKYIFLFFSLSECFNGWVVKNYIFLKYNKLWIILYLKSILTHASFIYVKAEYVSVVFLGSAPSFTPCVYVSSVLTQN